MQVMLVSRWRTHCGVTEYAFALKKELDAFADVQMIRVPTTRDRKLLLALAGQINKGDIAHIHFSQDFYGSWRYPVIMHSFMFLMKHIKIPVVITVHDLTYDLSFLKINGIKFKRIFYNIIIVPIINWTPYGRFLCGKFLDAADRIIVHATADKIFLQSLNIGAEKLSLLYPGIPQIETPNNESIRGEFGLKGHRLITVFGFIRPSKGYERIITIIKELPEDVVLIIAGGLRDEGFNSYLAKLKALIGSLGLHDRVKITGYLDNNKILSVLSASDVILLPYNQIRAGSYALSYAIAARRPVIASDNAFFNEIEEKYSAIKTFKNSDPQAIVKAINDALERRGREMQGAEEYRKIWNWKNVAEKTYKIYCDVLSKKDIKE